MGEGHQDEFPNNDKLLKGSEGQWELKIYILI